VHGIGHQAVAENRDAGGRALVAEQLQVHPPVVVDEKGVLAVVSALRDVVRTPGHDDTGHTRHGVTVPPAHERQLLCDEREVLT
jgi:hypothetical protein